MAAKRQLAARHVEEIFGVYLERETSRLPLVGHTAGQPPCVVCPEGEDGILLASLSAELGNAVVESQHFGYKQGEKFQPSEPALPVVLVVEKAIPIDFPQYARLQEYPVLVGTDDAEAVVYPAQGETAVAHSIEDAGEPLLAIWEIYGCTDVVVAQAAPIVQLVAEHPGIGLADEHILVVAEPQVEVLREAEVAVMRRGVEITFVEELCVHCAMFCLGSLAIGIELTSCMRDKHNLVTAQDTERLSYRRTLLSRGYILIYWYDDNAVLHVKCFICPGR